MQVIAVTALSVGRQLRRLDARSQNTNYAILIGKILKLRIETSADNRCFEVNSTPNGSDWLPLTQVPCLYIQKIIDLIFNNKQGTFFMKKYLIAFAALLCSYGIVNSSVISESFVQYHVGSNVVAVTENPINNVLHIFCAGVDENENGVYDEGTDEKPSWWRIDPNGSSTEPTMVKEFDDYFAEPFVHTTDITKGYATVVLNFAAVIENEVIVKNGYSQGFQMKSFVPAFKIDVDNGEPVIFKQFDTYSVAAINTITNQGTVSVINNESKEEKLVNLNDNIYSAIFVDLESDGTEELAVLTESGIFNFYQITNEAEATLVATYDASSKPQFTGEFGDLYADYGSVYTLFEGANAVLEITADYSGTVNSQITDAEWFQNPTVYYPLTSEWNIISNSDFETIVDSDFIVPEKHRTGFIVENVFKSGNILYLASGNTVKTFTIEDLLNRDSKFDSQIFTGYQPLDIMSDGNEYYVLNLGVDFDFNGVVDAASGDVSSSITKFIGLGQQAFVEGETREIAELPFYLNFPINTNLSFDGIMILPSGNKVYMFDVESETIIDSIDAGMYVTSAFSVLDYLVLGTRDYEEGKSYVRIINDEVGIDVSEEVGPNVIDVTVYQNGSGFGVISVSEGNFNESDATINILKLGFTGITENISIDAGMTGSNVVTNSIQTKAAVVMNGSHEIHIIDLLKAEKSMTFSTGTTGYGGPRDAIFGDKYLYVTTYSNKVLVFDSETGDKVSEYIVDGHSEGILEANAFFYIANNNYSNYKPSSRVVAYNKNPNITNVSSEANDYTSPIRIYPHPVGNEFHMVSDELVGELEIAIIDGQGKIVATHSAVADGEIAMSADELGLVAGNYTAIINGTKAVRFIVIK